MKFSKNEIIKIFKYNFPFLSNEDIGCLLNISTYSNKYKKEIIVKEGNRPDQVFFILKGYVRGFVTNELGQEKTIQLRDAGYFVGDSQKLFYNLPQKYTYVAISEVHILYLNYEDFEKLALEKPIIAKLLLEVYKEIIAAQSYRIELMIMMNAKKRYQHLVENKPDYLEEIEAKYIANFIGITPVSLSRIQKEIKNSLK